MCFKGRWYASSGVILEQIFSFQCAESLNIDAVDAITTCAESATGSNLLVNHGKQSMTLTLSFVPTIEVDGVCI